GLDNEWVLAAPSASSASGQKLLQKAVANWTTGQFINDFVSDF
ncbi:MAG: hypothetical protein EZS28_048901, partial [Streblomastix strix]